MKTPPKKPKLTNVTIKPELAERARDAAVFLAGPPLGLTVTSLVNQATEREIVRLQDEHNGGKRFPRRSIQVRKGRPVR